MALYRTGKKGATSSGLFPENGKALVLEGFAYDGIGMKSVSSPFTIAQGGLSSPVYAVCAGFLANIKDLGYTTCTISGAGGAYGHIEFYDTDGVTLSGGGRVAPNQAFAIPNDTAFLLYMANNYNDNAAHTISVTFA